LYFYKLEATANNKNVFREVHKMILLKWFSLRPPLGSVRVGFL
jgi:hypothetical protein